MLYKIALFLHVSGALMIGAALAIEWLWVINIRKADAMERIKELILNFSKVSRIGDIGAALVLLPGIFMMVTVWHDARWGVFGLVGFVLIAMIGGIVTGKKMKKNRLADSALADGELQQLGFVRERPAMRPEGRIDAVADDARGVRDELAHGRVRQRRTGLRQLRNPRPRGVIQPQLAGLDELHHGRRGEGLGVRGDAEEMRGRQRFAGLDIRDAVRLAELDLAVEPDRHLRPGRAELPDAVVKPGIDVGKCLPQDIDR